mmetsp:Transcript_113083/g.330516  ORF Transcript_113083/g.330516 Transcript_113083/m.330516 type:complete len:224 (+) Transcript_113083:1996-2667(+)
MSKNWVRGVTLPPAPADGARSGDTPALVACGGGAGAGSSLPSGQAPLEMLASLCGWEMGWPSGSTVPGSCDRASFPSGRAPLEVLASPCDWLGWPSDITVAGSCDRASLPSGCAPLEMPASLCDWGLELGWPFDITVAGSCDCASAAAGAGCGCRAASGAGSPSARWKSSCLRRRSSSKRRFCSLRCSQVAARDASWSPMPARARACCSASCERSRSCCSRCC